MVPSVLPNGIVAAKSDGEGKHCSVADVIAFPRAWSIAGLEISGVIRSLPKL